jgi:Tle cognate immunity protein 4 C-terminal domain/Tle cognate immunity protein 4 N-terminal domain
MKSPNKNKRYLIAAASIFFIAAVVVFFVIKHQPYSYKETGVPAHVELSPRLQKLFAKTKTVCFGRYVLDVPEEAQLIFGSFDIGASWKLYSEQAPELKKLVDQYRAKLLSNNPGVEILHDGIGPTENSWQIRSFEDKFAKQLELQGIDTFVVAAPHVFLIKRGTARSRGETVDTVQADNLYLSQNLRARDNAEIPKDPGVCIDSGFVADSSGKFQEIFEAGIHMPSIPDVSFSVSSNKLASVTDGNGASLLESIAEKKKQDGSKYPNLTVLREGARHVANWQGEESLVYRQDGVHDFAWEFVGKRTTELPASIDAKMYTKVAANKIGAANAASLTDDEAVAFWDKLLSSLRFRM